MRIIHTHRGSRYILPPLMELLSNLHIYSRAIQAVQSFTRLFTHLQMKRARPEPTCTIEFTHGKRGNAPGITVGYG